MYLCDYVCVCVCVCVCVLVYMSKGKIVYLYVFIFYVFVCFVKCYRKIIMTYKQEIRICSDFLPKGWQDQMNRNIFSLNNNGEKEI